MKTIRIQTLLAPVLVAAFVVLILGAASLWASPVRRGELHVIKDCSAKTGGAGSFCTITSSNLREIVAVSKVFYFQSPIGSTRLQDSHVVLDSRDGNTEVGNCMLDLATR